MIAVTQAPATAAVPTQQRHAHGGRPPSVALGLAEHPRHVREAIDAAYANGVAAGIGIGRRLEAEEEASWWSAMTRRIVALGTSPTAAELAERRGQPDRASEIRRTLAAREVVGWDDGPPERRRGPDAPHVEAPGTSVKALTKSTVTPIVPLKSPGVQR